MIHETKRKNIFTAEMQDFYSDRSTKEKRKRNQKINPNQEKVKEYDTERKAEPTLKRTNTNNKIFSPNLSKAKK